MKNKYKIIYCDPPWQYKNQRTRAATDAFAKEAIELAKAWGNECNNDIQL